jgi:predicted alpha/beta-hydrolase family hydrolase
MVDQALPARMRTIKIPPVGLEGLLGQPTEAKGIVLFAHGSGSGRFSPRNNFVADALRQTGLATLLFDLLTDDEARDRRNVLRHRTPRAASVDGGCLGQSRRGNRRPGARIFRRQHRR